MQCHNHYFMREQVKGLIPDLMKSDICGGRRKKTSFTELLVFFLAVAFYLAALGFSN